jgi:long-chain acyl-CoA synthetase
MGLIKILEEKARLHPEKDAVIFREEAISWDKLQERSIRLANSLKNQGVKKGDRVALYLPNWPEYIYSYLAVWVLGAIAVPLDFMLTTDELLSCLRHCEAKVFIFKPKANLRIATLKEKTPFLKVFITCQDRLEGCRFFNDCIEDSNVNALNVNIAEDEPAIIFYTSGTTGKPKGVLISYKQLLAPPKSMEFFVNSDLSDKDTTLSALPFSHLGGLIYIQNTICFSLRLILMERFIPLEFLRNIIKYKVSFFWIVPSMYYAFLQLKEFETFDLSSLRWIVTFGASSSPDALRRFHKFCPNAHLLNGWGMTETNAPTAVLPMGSGKIESVGRPAPWIEIKIFDDEGRVVQTGKIGEIVVKSWVVTSGYYKDPILTKESKSNGWFYTGDLGRLDEDGNLYIVGRKKEMIKVGGEIVFEPEVEAAIQKHEDIAEAAVVGARDDLRGEVPKAFVVLKEGKSLDEKDLRYYLRERLANFKIPHYFVFKDSLPKNRAGKIDKEKLRF